MKLSSHPCLRLASRLLLSFTWQSLRYAGHNKWSKIFRSKAIADMKRCQKTASCSVEIISAIKANGSDSLTNRRLSNALDRAKSLLVPKRIIENAINKGIGKALDGSEAIVYECKGPFNLPLIIEVMTDNKNRSALEIKHILSDYGGSIVEQSSILWRFSKKGIIEFHVTARAESNHHSSFISDLVTEFAVENECEDYEVLDSASGFYRILTATQDLGRVRQALVKYFNGFDKLHLEMIKCEHIYIPVDRVYKHIEDYCPSHSIEAGDSSLSIEDVEEEKNMITCCIEELQSLDCVDQIHTDIRLVQNCYRDL